MNNREIMHFNSFDRIRMFIVKHSVELNSVSLFAATKVKFDEHMGELEAAILKQVRGTKAITAEKKIVKKILASTIFKYAQRAWVQANLLEEMKLATGLKKTISYIAQAADKLAVSRATNLKALMEANKGILTEITDADIADMEYVIQNFSDMLTLPTSLIKERKTEGTEMIPQIIEKLKVDKEMMRKLVVSYLPQLADNWMSESKIGKYKGRRRISFICKFTEAGFDMPVSNVKCRIEFGDESKLMYSNKRGYIRGYSMQNGPWTLTAENDFYESIENYIIKVDDRRVERLVIGMRKKGEEI